MAVQLQMPVRPNPGDYGGLTSDAYYRAEDAYNQQMQAYNAAVVAGYGTDTQSSDAEKSRLAAAAEADKQRISDAAIQALKDKGTLDVVGAQNTGAATLADKNNAAALVQLQKQIESQQGMATQQQKADMDKLNAELGFKATDSAAERDARMAELTATNTAQAGLADKTIAGQLSLADKNNSGQLALETLKNAGAIGQIGAQTEGALSLANTNNAAATTLADKNNAAQYQQLQATIASQQGMATQQQQADMAKLEADLGFKATDSAAERSARMSELTATQSGNKDMAVLQSNLQNETDAQRFARSQQEAKDSRAAIDALVSRFGFAGGSPTGGDAVPQQQASAPAGADAADISAEDAAFARAKDKIGAVNESAKRGLSEDMSSRGITGSGIEAQQLGQQAQSGAGQLADVAQQSALETLKRRYQVSDRDAALASTKRGQDVGLVQSLAGSLKPTGTAY